MLMEELMTACRGSRRTAPRPPGRGGGPRGREGVRLRLRAGPDASVEASRVDAGCRGRAAPSASEAAGGGAAPGGRPVEGPGPRCHGRAGYPAQPRPVRRALCRRLDGAGVRRVVLYALRHTMATLVLRETK